MKIQEILKNHLIENPIKSFKKAIKDALDQKESPILGFKKEVLDFGLLLVNLKDKYVDVNLGDDKVEKFEPHLVIDIWNDADYRRLLAYFYGESNLVYAEKVWHNLPNLMYQNGYTRRSFRAPNNADYLKVNRINFLASMLEAPMNYDYPNSAYFGLSFEDAIRYDNDLSIQKYAYNIWATAIDMGNDDLYQLIEDIIYNKDAVGKVSRGIIKALLLSEQKKCWQLVEKLLLSAQRQEGLRQTILEALDETSTSALIYMTKVIVDNKLTRFSSVVRAIDTWTGLGWEAEKETVVRGIVEMAQTFFTNPDKIPTAIKSKNNSEVYMALWVQAVFDVEKTKPFLHDLLENGSLEKKCLAIRFASLTMIPDLQMPLYYKALAEENLQVQGCLFEVLEPLLKANSKSGYYADNTDFPDLFDKIYALTQNTVKEKVFEGKVFSWLNIKFDLNNILLSAIHLISKNNDRLEKILTQFESFSIVVKDNLARDILGEFYCYSTYSMNNKIQKKPTDFQKEFALRIIKERGESMYISAVNVLKYSTLSQSDVDNFLTLYKRKNALLKREITSIIIKQEPEIISNFIPELIEKGDMEQRLSGLDILIQLERNNILHDKVQNWVKTYSERPKLTEKETQLLNQLIPENKKELLTPENGFGFFDPKNVSPYELPTISEDGFYAQMTQKNQYGFSQPMSAIKIELEQLSKLFLENKNYQYEAVNYNNTKESLILANEFCSTIYDTKNLSDVEKFEAHPLANLWQEWFEASGLLPSDLFLLTFREEMDRKVWREILEKHVFYYKSFLPNPTNVRDWANPIKKIINILQLRNPFLEKDKFMIDACTNLYKNLPQSVLEYKIKENKNQYYYNSDSGTGWQAEHFFDAYLYAINYKTLDDADKTKAWNLYRWRQYSGLEENILHSFPPLGLYCHAFQHHLISKEELYQGVLQKETISFLTNKKQKYDHQHYNHAEFVKEYPFVLPIIDEIRDKFLDIELNRGDSNTTTTHFVQSFKEIYGIDRYVSLMKGLEKSNIYKGYIYSWNSDAITKQKLFSYLLKLCFPKNDETYTDFETAIKAQNFKEDRLVISAIYAPQWQKFVSDYLDWKGLDEGIWWLHAHTKTASYQDQNDNLESEIAKYSTIDIQDFKDGAVDIDWFKSMYKKLGKTRWEILYDSAKYITDGNGHRRARLYSDTLTGDLKIREVTAKVKDKRDQDYLRVYGLVPLSKTSPEKDVLARYEYIQQFKKESREFGSMKQASEALAIRVALENLARNAGYPDPVRLTWAMETKQVQQILSKDTAVTIDGVTVGLVIDDEGKADLVTSKDDKELKSIPAKIKKDKAILELNQHKKTLSEQWKRSRKGLEEAMIRGDEFMFSELTNLYEHPVISSHLRKLIFISNENQIGFFVKNNLVTAQGECIEVTENQTFRIAHCYDLHNHKVWVDFQKYCFDNSLKQPFKQVFRELYIPTQDELNEKSVSRRYAGHQVQPRQTLALLKTRGWKVDYQEGLQKVFHKEGFQVKLYAMADWFSPADIESPTLETIEFHSLKDYKNIAFEDINPRIFSEVMRDIDLVVSVAHVGGVDPEASHSTIEMRSMLLKETLRLFKITNVNIDRNHAFIKGTLAEYSIHLGSAVVHQMPARYLSILPVHSQHRGRLFLPFADDDPKSAEVLSKVILLAKDNEIQDPTILSQIERL